MNYRKYVLSKEVSQEAIKNRLAHESIDFTRLATAIQGIVDEAGELMGAYKAYREYGRTLDITNLIEEGGDIYFRLEQLCVALENITQRPVNFEVLETSNREKLDRRYKKGFTQEEEQNRDRVLEAEVIRKSSIRRTK